MGRLLPFDVLRCMTEVYFAVDERNPFSMIPFHRANNLKKKKKTKSDSNHSHKPWFGCSLPGRDQNWSLERIFLRPSPGENTLPSRNWIGFPYFTHNPHHLRRAEHWVLHVSLYAWIHLPYMGFVTFTIKKSLFITESGRTERVQLKTSIGRERKLRVHVALSSIWSSLFVCQDSFFQIKGNASLWSQRNVLSDIDPDSDLYITSKNAIKLWYFLRLIHIRRNGFEPSLGGKKK